MTAILAILANPLLRKLIMGALAAAAVVGAFVFYTEKVKHEAVTQVRAQLEAAAETEHRRRQSVLNQAQQQASVYAQRVEDIEKKNESLQREIARLSAAHDHEPCLDADSVRRLREIGRPHQ